MATVGFNSELRIYDLKTNRVIKRLECECPDNHAVAFSADGTKLAAGGRSGIIRVWDVATGRQINQMAAHRQRVRSIVFSQNEELISCGDDQIVRITPLSDPTQFKTLPKHQAKLFSIELLAKDFLATGGSDNLIHIWRIGDASEIGTLRGHTGTVSSIDVDGNQIVSGSFDTQVRVWTFENMADPAGRHTRLPSNWNRKSYN